MTEKQVEATAEVGRTNCALFRISFNDPSSCMVCEKSVPLSDNTILVLVHKLDFVLCVVLDSGIIGAFF